MSGRERNPLGVQAPGGAFSHAVEVAGPGRFLFISGQVGVDADGVLADGFEAQATQCWRNVVATLADAGMTVHDLVKTTAFITDPGDAAAYARVRLPFLEGARPASTLVGTSSLMRPEWRIELEAIAFRND